MIVLCKAVLSFRRYEKAQKPLSAFDADITKYADLSEEVLAENAAESIKFLFVDCGPLKQVAPRAALLEHCANFELSGMGVAGLAYIAVQDPSSIVRYTLSQQHHL